MLKKIVNATMLLTFVACSSATTIRTTEKDVSIYVDGEYRGKGEVIHEDQKIVGSTTYVELKKEGCENKQFHFSRNEEASVGAIIGGLFVWVPFLWVMKYKPEHNYEYECKKTVVSKNN